MDTEHSGFIMREFDLPQSCTVATVKALHSQLAELAANQSDVSIDASSVSVIDAAALQTLCAFVLAQRQSGCDVSWKKPSQPFGDAARLLGLKDQLGLQ